MRRDCYRIAASGLEAHRLNSLVGAAQRRVASERRAPRRLLAAPTGRATVAFEMGHLKSPTNLRPEMRV
jgi:hypothetical protein